MGRFEVKEFANQAVTYFNACFSSFLQSLYILHSDFLAPARTHAEAEFDASQSQRMKLNLCKDRAGGRVLNGAQLCHHLLPLCLTGCLQALEV